MSTRAGLVVKPFGPVVGRGKEKESCVYETRRLYLAVGERVIHMEHPEWGVGLVVEEARSTVPGGMCMVRIEFADGKKRVFNNDMECLDSCWYAGIRRHP